MASLPAGSLSRKMTTEEFERLRIGDPVHWEARGISGAVADVLHNFWDKSILIKSGDALIWASYRNVEKGEKHYEHERRTYRKKSRNDTGRKR